MKPSHLYASCINTHIEGPVEICLYVFFISKTLFYQPIAISIRKQVTHYFYWVYVINAYVQFIVCFIDDNSNCQVIVDQGVGSSADNTEKFV